MTAALAITESHACGKSKVEVYDWTVVDRKGELTYISKELLNIDHRYQRDNVSNSRVLSIAKDWSWMACGVLLVARRASDGTLWVYDGQHRKLAADKRDDVKDLPCCVFDASEIRVEAQAFNRANTVRGSMRKIDQYKALLVAKDKDALAVDQMIRESGYEAKRTHARFGVACVGTLMAAHRQDPNHLRQAWSFCVELFDGEAITSPVLSAILVLETHLKKHDQTVLRGHNREKLLSEGVDAMNRKFAEASAFHGKGGPRIHAQGLVLLLNKGRRTRHVPAII